MSQRPDDNILDDAWDSVVGGLGWLKNVLIGEFADNRPLSAVVADMLVSFIPGVVLVTSARDAIAVTLRLANYPEKRNDLMEWVLLCACLIVIALPLAMAAGGAAAAGVGAIVGGIAGSELGAALRAVMLMLIKQASKLVEVVQFLQKFIKGDILKFLRAIQFAKYEKPLMAALGNTIKKLQDIVRGLRGHLQRLSYFTAAQRAIAKLAAWEKKFYAVQQDALKQIPRALAELDARLAKVLAQTAPKEAHSVSAGVKAPKPAVRPLDAQRVKDAPGKPLAMASGRPTASAASKPKPAKESGKSASKPPGPQKMPSDAGSASGSKPPKPPPLENPKPPKQPDEPPNTKRQSAADASFEGIYSKAPAAKIEIDAIADEIAGRYGGRVAKAPIKSEKRALEKINADYGGDPSRIKDLARNTIIVPHDRIAEVVTELEQRGAAIKRILASDNPYGYSGINSTIKTRAGIPGEIQVNSPEMIFAKEPAQLARTILGDDLYDAVRSKVGMAGGRGHELYEVGRQAGIGSDIIERVQAESRDYYNAIRKAFYGD